MKIKINDPYTMVDSISIHENNMNIVQVLSTIIHESVLYSRIS